MLDYGSGDRGSSPLRGTNFRVMYSLKDYPEEYSRNQNKQWRKFRKKIKKIFHTKLRRGELDKLKATGYEIAW